MPVDFIDRITTVNTDKQPGISVDDAPILIKAIADDLVARKEIIQRYKLSRTAVIQVDRLVKLYTAASNKPDWLWEFSSLLRLNATLEVWTKKDLLRRLGI